MYADGFIEYEVSKISCSASGLGAYFVPNCPALRSKPNFQGPSLMLMRLKSNVIFLCIAVINGQVGKLSMLTTLQGFVTREDAKA